MNYTSLLYAILFLTISTCLGATTPGPLLIYYGFPSLINGSNGNLSIAAQTFALYKIVIIGDCLQEDGTAVETICPHSPHPDHSNTIDIINHSVSSTTDFFGYIDLGIRNTVDGTPRQNLSLTEIQRRAGLWADMGVVGILLDDFGYDFEVSRQRQRDAIAIIHDQGLSVIANGFRVEDVFSDSIDPVFNPLGLPVNMDDRDYYLYESHQISLGQFINEIQWQNKANSLESFRQKLNFRIVSTTTSNIGSSYDESQFFYSWHSAAMYQHAATGWGELFFSAGDNAAPFRIRPDIEISEFISDISQQGSIYQRTACNGIISVNAAAGIHSFGLTAGEFCLLFADGFENSNKI